MNRIARCACLLAVVVVVACAPPAAKESAEIRARSASWAVAFNARDTDALAELYADNARMMPPNAQLVMGRAAIKNSFNAMMEAGLTIRVKSLETMEAGDVGHNVGTYALDGADGAEVDRGKFIETWKRVDGEWRIGNDIYNSDLPAVVEEMLLESAEP